MIGWIFCQWQKHARNSRACFPFERSDIIFQVKPTYYQLFLLSSFAQILRNTDASFSYVYFTVLLSWATSPFPGVTHWENFTLYIYSGSVHHSGSASTLLGQQGAGLRQSLVSGPRWLWAVEAVCAEMNDCSAFSPF